MADEHLILTTPPVRSGPEFAEKEISGAGEAVSKTGVASRIRSIVEQVGIEAAAKTSLPVVIPTKQLVSALLALFADLPRIPDYDSVAAHTANWRAFEYSPLEIPENEPDSLGTFVRDQGPDMGKVCVELARPADGTTTTLDFEPDEIESFFLSGLAACAYARTLR